MGRELSKSPKSRGCWRLKGTLGDLLANVINQVVYRNDAVLVVVGGTVQGIQQEVAESAMAAAELRPFVRDFTRAAGHHAEDLTVRLS